MYIISKRTEYVTVLENYVKVMVHKFACRILVRLENKV